MTRFASPTKDSTFKLLFGEKRHKALTIDFLNSFLERTPGNLIKDISFMKEEQTPRALAERKSILDIHCKDEANNQFIIEMQASKEAYFVARALYYAASLLSRQLETKDLFTDLKQVIVIAILDYTLLDTHKEYISHQLICDMNTGKQSTNLIELHFIELTKFKKKEHELITHTDKWIYFLKNAHKLSSIPENCLKTPIQKAFDLMEQNKWTPEQIACYELDLLNFKKNLTQNHALLEQGAQEKAEAIAINLLKIGLSIEQVAQGTGLSIEQVEKLER